MFVVFFFSHLFFHFPQTQLQANEVTRVLHQFYSLFWLFYTSLFLDYVQC